MRVLAVDWSGRAVGARRHLWLAEADRGELVRLECGRSREQLVDHLVELAETDGDLVVGLDFSFSLPAWFLDRQGHRSADELWAAAARDGDGWLHACEPPFWGLPGRRRPVLPAHFRVTEAELDAVGGIRPKSTFQIGGAGSVGTGSVRGWPHLARLRAAGFSVWPFHSPAPAPVAVEIYPRLFTGAVVKTDPAARAVALRRELPGLADDLRDLALASDDAFDAAVSAVVMSRHAAELRALPAVDDPIARREGSIWRPGAPAAVT